MSWNDFALFVMKVKRYVTRDERSSDVFKEFMTAIHPPFGEDSTLSEVIFFPIYFCS